MKGKEILKEQRETPHTQDNAPIRLTIDFSEETWQGRRLSADILKTLKENICTLTILTPENLFLKNNTEKNFPRKAEVEEVNFHLY